MIANSAQENSIWRCWSLIALLVIAISSTCTAFAQTIANTATIEPALNGADLVPGNNSDADTDTVVAAQPIAAVSDTSTTLQNTPVTTQVLANDTINGAVIDPAMVSVAIATLPMTGAVTVNSDGTITYTPSPNFTGVDTYAYQICEIVNPSNCVTATVTVTINPIEVVAADDSASTLVNTPVEIAILGNDTANGTPLDPRPVSFPTLPANGTLALNSDGSVTYTPNQDYAGSDAFSYQVCDSSTPSPVCDVAMVTVIVTGSPPVANPDNEDVATGQADQPLVIPVLNNDTDADGNIDPATIVISGAGDDGKTLTVLGEGTWAVNNDGTLTFLPELGFLGEVTPIQYTVADSTELRSNPATVRANILGTVQLRTVKVVQPRDVKIGDLVRYTVTVENTGTVDAIDATLVDTPPAGFTFVDGSLSVADRDGVGRLVGTYPIQVDQVDIAAGERATFTYLLRVGVGVRAGIHSNSAVMRDNGKIVSNVATAEVQLIADPLLDQALILGTVFDDRDSDGWQDSAAIDDARVQGGFAAQAYVPNSTTVDRGNGPKAEPDAGSPMLHGIVLGSISGRQSDADPVAAHSVVISQRLKELSFNDDFALTTKQGVTVRMDAAGTTRIERSGDAAKNLSGAAPTVERRVSPTEGGYVVDYIVRNTGVDERGIPGARIASIEGLLMETDQYGRYHLEGVDVGTLERGRNFILKVDPSTLPPGTVFTTDNPLTRRVTPGLPVRFDWGAKLSAGLIEGGEERVEMELGELFFAPGAAEIRPGHAPLIEKMAAKINQHRISDVVISANGDTESLAFDRASAVKAALVKQLPADVLQALKVSVRGNADDPGSLIVGLGEGGALLGTVLFDTDKETIKPEFEPLLDKVAAALERMRGGVIAIVGHTDVRASYQYNTALGMRRAKAVYDALAQRLSPEVRAKVRVESSNDPVAPVDVKRN